MHIIDTVYRNCVIKNEHKQVIKRFHRNNAGIAVVNKVHIQVWIPLQLAPYIVTYNHPYISSCNPDLLRSTVATYVGMFMCDNVRC